jgi:RNA polymerase sigma-70 factor (ECF subfamily)
LREEPDALGVVSLMLFSEALRAARAEILVRVGKKAEAVAAYDRAIGLEPDPAVRDFLQRRRAAVKRGLH